MHRKMQDHMSAKLKHIEATEGKPRSNQGLESTRNYAGGVLTKSPAARLRPAVRVNEQSQKSSHISPGA